MREEPRENPRVALFFNQCYRLMKLMFFGQDMKIQTAIDRFNVTVKEISSALGYPVSAIHKIMPSLQNQQKITKIKGAKYCQTQYAHFYLSNPLINCACGCGEQFNKFDNNGRTRKYRSGHHFKK